MKWEDETCFVFQEGLQLYYTRPAPHRPNSDRIRSPSPRGAALETLPGTKLETGNETNTRCSDTTVINSPTKKQRQPRKATLPYLETHDTSSHILHPRSYAQKSFLNYTFCTDCEVYRKAKHVVTRTLCRRNFRFVSLKNVL